MKDILPFVPETLLEMQARYPEAIAEPFDEELVGLGTQAKPGTHRRNVFDSADGMRLVVSHQTRACGCRWLAVAAHVIPGTAWARDQAGPMDMMSIAEGRFAMISGDDGGFRVRGMQREGSFSFWRRIKECRPVSFELDIEITIGGER